MALAVKTQHLKRYKDIALLFIKHGRGDLLEKSDLFDDTLRHQPAQPVAPEAKELAEELQKMGPTFIKLGQLLSTRADFLPSSYLEALAKLQDRLDPFPFDQVEAIVAVELGVRISKAFASFDSTPIAAASLGQVHRAALRDGRPVAVKVQRPGIREEMVEDLEALAEIAQVLDSKTELGRRYEFSSFVEQVRKALLRELDYRQEASNLRILRDRLRDHDRIVIPAPVEDYTTSRVLTMDYVNGTKITTLSPVVRTEIDGAELAEQLFRAYLQQILVDGFFHADPHPGNVFLTDDHRVALIDLGMVAHVSPRLQEHLMQLLLAISEGRSDDAAEAAMKIGERKEAFDEMTFRREIAGLVQSQQNATIAQLQVGRIVLSVTQTASATAMRVPPELTMLGKTLLNLDLIGRTLDPDFNPNESIRRNAAAIVQQRLLRSLSPGNLISGLLEVKDLFQRLPFRLNKLLDALAGNDLRIKVDTIDENTIMSGLQKIANRITLGLILAALIVGAALLMRVETHFRLFGYPGLAIVCFLLAVAGGLALAMQIVLHDWRNK